MIKIAFVISRLGVGGAETQLVQLVTGLDKSRFAVSVVCTKDEGPLAERVRDAGVPVRALHMRHGWNPDVVRRLRGVFRDEQPDIVHCTNFNSTLWGRLAAIWSGVDGIIVAEHSTKRLQLRQRIAIPFINQLLAPYTDAVVACGDSQVPVLVSEKHRPDRISVIVNGVDTALFNAAGDRLRAKRALGLPADTAAIGIVAALRPEKNHEMFLRAGAELIRTGESITLVVVGDGPRRSHLEALARAMGIASSVHFMGSRDDVSGVLGGMDVAALTSVSETFPLTLLEAMSAGLPVVATAVGDVPRIVQDGRTGFVVPPGDESGLTQRLRELVRDASVRSAMGEAGSRRVRDHFTVGAMVEKYEALFDATGCGQA